MCTALYKASGGSLLHDDGGVLFRYKTDGSKEQVQKYMLDHIEIVGNLKVKNSTYELEMLDTAQQSAYHSEAYSATKYFNSRTQVNNKSERVLATLMTGLTWDDLMSAVKDKSIKGLERDITVESLNKVHRDYGKTLLKRHEALPYMAKMPGQLVKEDISAPGDLVQWISRILSSTCLEAMIHQSY